MMLEDQIKPIKALGKDTGSQPLDNSSKRRGGGGGGLLSLSLSCLFIFLTPVFHSGGTNELFKSHEDNPCVLISCLTFNELF